MKTCKTCGHWTKEFPNDEICYPINSMTGILKPLKGLGIRYCKAAKEIDKNEGLPLDGFGVGNNYGETLYTAENFGCVKHSGYTK